MTTPRHIDDALAVVHSPGLVADQPNLRLDAWATLMQARGQRVNAVRLCAMQHSLANMRGLAAHLLQPPGPPFRNHAEEIAHHRAQAGQP